MNWHKKLRRLRQGCISLGSRSILLWRAWWPSWRKRLSSSWKTVRPLVRLTSVVLLAVLTMSTLVWLAYDASIPPLLRFLPPLTFTETLGLTTLAALGYTLYYLLRDRKETTEHDDTDDRPRAWHESQS